MRYHLHELGGYGMGYLWRFLHGIPLDFWCSIYVGYDVMIVNSRFGMCTSWMSESRQRILNHFQSSNYAPLMCNTSTTYLIQVQHYVYMSSRGFKRKNSLSIPGNCGYATKLDCENYHWLSETTSCYQNLSAH
jgi:hypothetical protein